MSTDTQSRSTVAVGDAAPDFELHSTDLEPWRLSDHTGSPVVLLFFPGAFTSVCTDELNTVNNDLDAYGDATIVGVSTDSPFVLEEFAKVHDLDFTLLSDHNAEVAGRYGAKYDNDFTPMKLDRIARRAAFVIDAHGVLRYTEVLESAGDQPDFDAIKQALNDL